MLARPRPDDDDPCSAAHARAIPRRVTRGRVLAKLARRQVILGPCPRTLALPSRSASRDRTRRRTSFSSRSSIRSSRTSVTLARRAAAAARASSCDSSSCSRRVTCSCAARGASSGSGPNVHQGLGGLDTALHPPRLALEGARRQGDRAARAPAPLLARPGARRHLPVGSVGRRRRRDRIASKPAGRGGRGGSRVDARRSPDVEALRTTAPSRTTPAGPASQRKGSAPRAPACPRQRHGRDRGGPDPRAAKGAPALNLPGGAILDGESRLVAQ